MQFYEIDSKYESTICVEEMIPEKRENSNNFEVVAIRKLHWSDFD